MSSVAVVGLGETGVRAARQLLDTPGIDRVVVAARTAERARAVADALHDGAEPFALDDDLPLSVDAIASALPARLDPELGRRAVDHGIPFASVSDHGPTISALVALDESARENGVAVVVGCGLAPGLADVLARHAAGALDAVDEIHVARFGISGPECAATARHALGAPGREWRYGVVRAEPRRGRELVWFPDLVGARECQLVATGLELLVAANPGVERATVRLGVPQTRRFPMARRDPASAFGAARVEVWGWRGPERTTVVYGVIERTAVGAGTVLGVTAAWLAGALPDFGRVVPGAGGLGQAVKPVAFLAELARRGVKAAVFEGVGAV